MNQMNQMTIAYALKIIENLAEKRQVLFVDQIKSIEKYPAYYSPRARLAVKTIAIQKFVTN